MKIKTLVVYSLEKNLDIDIPAEISVSRANPKFWNGVPRPIHDAVYAPAYPAIEKAHKAAGKVVWRPEGDSEAVVEEPVQEPVEAPMEEAVEEGVEEETPAEDEGHWSELSWPKMRSLATQFTDDPVKSKDQARDILLDAEAEGKI